MVAEPVERHALFQVYLRRQPVPLFSRDRPPTATSAAATNRTSASSELNGFSVSAAPMTIAAAPRMSPGQRLSPLLPAVEVHVIHAPEITQSVW